MDGDIFVNADDFTEDMLDMVSMNVSPALQSHVFVSVGWLPSGDPNGEYMLAIEDEHTPDPHRVYKSTSQPEIVALLEHCLALVMVSETFEELNSMLPPDTDSSPSSMQLQGQMTTPELFPLRVPTRWSIMFNRFYKQDIIIDGDRFVNVDNFTGDMLHIVSIRNTPTLNCNVFLRVGWLPGGDPNGRYVLSIEKEGESEPYKVYESRSQAGIVDILERCLALVMLSVSAKTLDSMLDQIHSA